MVVIDVRMSDILAERALSGEMRLRLAYEAGMRAGDVLRREGFRGEELQAILTMVNGEQRPHAHPLADGDTVELVIPMVGGGPEPPAPLDSLTGPRALGMMPVSRGRPPKSPPGGAQRSPEVAASAADVTGVG